MLKVFKLDFLNKFSQLSMIWIRIFSNKGILHGLAFVCGGLQIMTATFIKNCSSSNEIMWWYIVLSDLMRLTANCDSIWIKKISGCSLQNIGGLTLTQNISRPFSPLCPPMSSTESYITEPLDRNVLQLLFFDFSGLPLWLFSKTTNNKLRRQYFSFTYNFYWMSFISCCTRTNVWEFSDAIL